MLHRILVLLLLLSPPVAAWAADFVPGTEDVPVMKGLKPVTDSAVVFDKPQGRIVEAQFHGKLGRRQVEDFYAATLPQLGWKSGAADSWQREDETLHLEFTGRDGDLKVGFTLSPH